MLELYAEIQIDASVERVWDVLMDFERYPEWNPFIQSISGSGEIGSKLKVKLKLEGRKPAAFKPKVLAKQPHEEFRWLGKLLLPGIFDGEHILLIREEGDGRVKFIQQEYFRGIFAASILRRIGEATQQGFEAMNKALKERAENPGQ
jgi:hypothetical protein